MSEDALKALDLAIAGLDKQYGQNSVVKLGSDSLTKWPSIPTGALTLDIALGIGVLPRGRIVEMYGPESSGKTTLALMVVAAAQAGGGKCCYIDAEHALDPNYARDLGVDVDEMYISQPDTAEQALETCDRLVATGALDVVVIDSVAALTPKAELDGEVGDSHMGLLARLMGQTLRKINGNAHKTETLVIFVNQIREKIGVMFGSPETQPGGRALKFFSSVRIDIRKIEIIKDKETGLPSGVKTKAKVIKNKMAPPYREAEFDIIYGRGINSLGCIFDLGVKYGFIEKSGAWYAYEGEQMGQGRPNCIQALASDMEMTGILEKKIRETVGML
jgi:recombination protein RecA